MCVCVLLQRGFKPPEVRPDAEHTFKPQICEESAEMVKRKESTFKGRVERSIEKYGKRERRPDERVTAEHTFKPKILEESEKMVKQSGKEFESR